MRTDARRDDLEPDAARAVAAIIADLDAIGAAVPDAGSTCRRAARAFAFAFAAPAPAQWQRAALAARSVIAWSGGARSAAADAARARLAAFVVENGDLLEPPA